MRVGFTGTRQELTTDQHHALCELVKRLNAADEITEWRHGACVGADCESVDVVRQWAPNAQRIAHPPTNRSMISRQALDLSHVILDALPYLERNKAIVEALVDGGDVLIACPKGEEEVRGSGTWHTIRHARRLGRHIIIVWPNGEITEETR